VPNPEEAREFSLPQNVQTFPTAHPDSYYFVSGNISLAVQRPVRELNHPLRCSAEAKNKWNCTSTNPVCLHCR